MMERAIEFLFKYRPLVFEQGDFTFGALAVLDDPEAIFQEGRLFCDVGEHALGLPHLERAQARGNHSNPGYPSRLVMLGNPPNHPAPPRRARGGVTASPS